MTMLAMAMTELYLIRFCGGLLGGRRRLLLCHGWCARLSRGRRRPGPRRAPPRQQFLNEYTTGPDGYLLQRLRSAHPERQGQAEFQGFVKMGKVRSADRENETEKRAQEKGAPEGFSA